MAVSSSAFADPPLTVPIASCPGATVTGIVADYAGGAPGKMRQFLGIPYAAPPIGKLRWQPPQPHCWTGNRTTQASFSPVCAQGDGSFSTEDCLYLNVFTAPKGKVSKQPVMVFIHGGAFVSGASRFFFQNPAALVAQGVVVVSIDYRLGAFGFLAHPALDNRAKHETGNYGFLDQQAALKWVKANISAFGGNPKNVTIFGQSAGGLSVLVHLLSPLSKGLFQKAIIESGSFYLTPTPLSTAETEGVSFAQSVGCPGTGAAAVNCLRKLDYKTILANQGPLGQSTALLKVDSLVLPDTIKNLLVAGRFQAVPVINGSNHDEMRFHLVGDQSVGSGDSCHYRSNITPANYQQSLSHFFHSDFVPNVAAHYPTGSTDLSANAALTAARSDWLFMCTAYRVDNWVAARTKIYAYELNDEKAPNNFTGPVTMADGSIFPLGAFHNVEQSYIFPGNTGVCGNPYRRLNLKQRKLAAAMVTYWTTFAKTGNPNPTAGTKPPNWPRYSGASGNMLSLLSPAPKVMTATSFNTDHKCTSFWDTTNLQ